MKLTEKQKDALQLLKEKKSLSKDGCKIHNNMMNALYFKGLVRLSRYANGEFWEITDTGLEATNLSNTTKLTSSKLTNKPTNTQLFYIMC